MDSNADFLVLMTMLNIIGIAASLLTAFSLLPRLIKTFKTKKPSGISWEYYWFLLIGLLAWSLYGLLCEQFIVASTSSLALLEIALLMFWKSKYD